MSIDFNNIQSIIGGFNKVIKLSSMGSPPPIPTIIILTGVPMRSGLSPIKIASRIIARKGEAGLSVGVLPSGGISPDEIMERIRIEEIIKALQEESIIRVAIPAGIVLTANGTSPSGPVTVFGSTIAISNGYGIIQ